MEVYSGQVLLSANLDGRSWTKEWILNFSNTGKRLMAKCRRLITENEELGKMVEAGRLARLEGELAMTRKEADNLKNGQSGSNARCSSPPPSDRPVLSEQLGQLGLTARRARSTAMLCDGSESSPSPSPSPPPPHDRLLTHPP